MTLQELEEQARTSGPSRPTRTCCDIMRPFHELGPGKVVLVDDDDDRATYKWLTPDGRLEEL
jgi:hypothetical protein